MPRVKYVFVELWSKFFRVEFEQNFDKATSAMSKNVTKSHDGNLNKISTEAKWMYLYLFNSLGYSIQDGIANEKDEVYINYTMDMLAKTLEISNAKVKSALKELIDTGLIIEEKTKKDMPNRIYITKEDDTNK